ncbi:sigma 54-interacting transcriptional regulator [Edaphobacter aggregans]|uniref:sigma 54-interacting transcriptional regulator n=1 Tax=Edaphobacter aggregans TaxID=570835 RepID=UPI00068BE6AC|nr:sigma 54-interacting transcriptional regulator [Edaphobacter aggregans]
MKPRLLVISGSLPGTVRHLVEGQFFIGRDEANQLCLTDPAVSRRHCMLQQLDEHYELVDLDSRHGTFVNGVPVRRKLIEHGDTIRVGRSELVFLSHEGDEMTQATAIHSDLPAISTLSTIRMAPPVPPTFGVEVGRMARDLAALFRISNVINSIRDSELLQHELLRLIFEVIPAEKGAVLLLTDLDEGEPASICTNSRQLGDSRPIEVQRELVHRAIWERSAVFTNAATEASQNVLCLPLVAVEKTIGVIYLTSPRSSPPFHEDHIHFLDSVSRIAAVTLENILALDALRSENSLLKAELNPACKLVGESRQIGQVEEFISRVAQSDSTVLIRGESGTGKELVACAIHHSSPRSDRPFIAINCAAIPETLLESELFGHEKGAFTGAVGTRKGKLEAAENGTLFLDEIGELAPPMQAKLLRVLQQREFERVGGAHPIPFKARVLAATNKNLEQALKSGDFRQDLYYRLNVVSVTVPPLREHREDIPLLALYFAAKYAEKSKRPFKGISQRARTLLMGYSWPGNVRELENAIEHAIVLGLTEEILPEDLPVGILEEQSAGLAGARYHDALNQTKRELVLNALREANGSYPEAARSLNIHPKYLHRLARNLKLKSEAG